MGLDASPRTGERCGEGALGQTNTMRWAGWRPYSRERDAWGDLGQGMGVRKKQSTPRSRKAAGTGLS